MIAICELGTDTKREYIDKIAKLHAEAFPRFFLTQLGMPFLRTLYQCYIKDESSGVFVAEDGEELLGFIAYSKDYPAFYKNLIRHHLLRFALCSLRALIRHPSFARRLLAAFRKSDAVVKNEKYVQLASICVKPQTGHRGIGSALVQHLIQQTDFESYAYINLETDAQDNEAVNRFYQKNGFRLARQFETSEGRKMNEYRYSPEDAE